MDDARLALLAQLPEHGLDPHPDLHIARLDADELGGQTNPLIHLEDPDDVGLLHLELGRRVVDDGERHKGPFPAEPEAVHLPEALAPAVRADLPRGEVDLPATPALRTDEVVSARGLPPEPRNRPLKPPPPPQGAGPWPPPPEDRGGGRSPRPTQGVCETVLRPDDLALARLPAELPHDFHGLGDTRRADGLAAGVEAARRVHGHLPVEGRAPVQGRGAALPLFHEP